MRPSFAYLSVCTALSFLVFMPPSHGANLVRYKGSLVPLPPSKPAELLMKDPAYMAKRPIAATFANGETVHSEDLLDADGTWSVVEKGKYDPSEAHLKARKSVNIKRRNTDSSLSAHFEPDAKSGEDGKMRVLQVEGAQKTDWNDLYADMKPVLKSQPTAKSGVKSKAEPEAEKGSGFSLLGFLSGGQEEGEEDRGADDDARVVVDAVIPGVKPNVPARFVVADSKVVIPPPQPKPQIEEKRAESSSLSAPKLVKLAGVPVPIPQNKPIMHNTRPQQSNAKPARVFEVGDENRATAHISKIRSGIYQGKTRIVVEASEKPSFKTMVDPLRNVLRVKIMNSKWGAAPQGTLGGGAILGTYVVREQRDGSALLEVRLKEPTEILNAIVLGPNAVSQNRIVIDLTK